MSTIFSKIIAGEVDCFKVYEDDVVLAFLDKAPLQPGHTLVIPKEPSKDGLVCEPEILAHVMKVAQSVAQAQKEILSCDGVNFIMNNGAAAGQEVFHTHLHVVPRYEDDGVFESPLRGEYEEGEEQTLASELANKLSK